MQIEISFDDLAITVLVLTFLSLLFLMVSYNSTRRQMRRRSLRRIMTCNICGHVYSDESGDKIVDCPECGRANQRGRDKSLG